MSILNQFFNSRFLGRVFRSCLMYLRHVRRGNPVQRDIWGQTVTLNYANGTHLRAIDAFPNREPEFSERLLASLDSMITEPCLLDIGANIGLYVVASAKHKSRATVHAFEPDNLNFKVLKQNVGNNNLTENVILWKVALGLKSGRLFADQSKSGSGSFSPTNDMNNTEIEVRCVDDMWNAGLIGKPTHILLDVEGAEYDVIGGAQEMLSALKPEVFVEVHHQKLTDFGTNMLAFHAKMLSLGYELDWLRTPKCGPGEHSQFHAVYSIVATEPNVKGIGFET